jgi:hypothetical protein
MSKFQLKRGDLNDLPSSLDEGDHYLALTDNGSNLPKPILFVGPNGGGTPEPTNPTTELYGQTTNVDVTSGSDVELFNFDTGTTNPSPMGGQLVRKDSDNKIYWENFTVGDKNGFTSFDVATGFYGRIDFVPDSGDGSATTIMINGLGVQSGLPVSDYTLPDDTYEIYVLIKDVYQV